MHPPPTFNTTLPSSQSLIPGDSGVGSGRHTPWNLSFKAAFGMGGCWTSMASPRIPAAPHLLEKGRGFPHPPCPSDSAHEACPDPPSSKLRSLTEEEQPGAELGPILSSVLRLGRAWLDGGLCRMEEDGEELGFEALALPLSSGPSHHTLSPDSNTPTRLHEDLLGSEKPIFGFRH